MSADERIAAAQKLLYSSVEVQNLQGEVYAGTLYGYEPTSDTYVIHILFKNLRIIAQVS